jgi:hypothetical protein
MKEKELLRRYYHILGLTPNQSRKAEQVKARAAMMTAMRQSGLKLHHIAEIFGSDHSTVVHHTRKHEANLKYWDGYEHKYTIASGLCGTAIRDKAIKWKIRNLNSTIKRLSGIKENLEKQLNPNSYERTQVQNN